MTEFSVSIREIQEKYKVGYLLNVNMLPRLLLTLDGAYFHI